jgi:hypothetical protein
MVLVYDTGEPKYVTFHSKQEKTVALLTYDGVAQWATGEPSSWTTNAWSVPIVTTADWHRC